MKTTRFLILVAVVLALSRVQARELTIEDALALAESHSYRIKAGRAQSDAFSEGLKAAVAERLPTLSATGVASYRDEIAQLDVELPTGDVLRRDIGLKENYQVDLRLSLPLFTGGRISGTVDLARSTSDYYKAIENAAIDEVLLAARLNYLSLYKSDRLVEAARAGLKRATTTLSDVQSLYDAGAADSVDILDARMAVTGAQATLDNALSSRRRNEISLSVLLGLSPSEPIKLDFNPGRPDTTALGNRGISGTKPELLAAGSAVEMSRSVVKVSRSDLFPSISVFGGYSWGKPNLDQFHDEFNDYLTVGTTVKWSFNLGGKPARNVRKAKRQVSAAEFEYQRTKERLDRNARVILENLRLTYQNFETATVKHSIASDNCRLAAEKHREGVLSANRLVEIEAALSEAEAHLASTRADFYMVESQYYHALGSELLKEGI
ncbi:MAG: TolC family protein [Candidatus Zixiibacteriota bacterium]|nr:MAG: TolC family protein [candidate division Zixibacteria bacterium]